MFKKNGVVRNVHLSACFAVGFLSTTPTCHSQRVTSRSGFFLEGSVKKRLNGMEAENMLREPSLLATSNTNLFYLSTRAVQLIVL